MAIKISKLKPQKSFITELSEDETTKIFGSGSVGGGGIGGIDARVLKIAALRGGVGEDGTGA
jgi:hypothetical protein